MHQNTKKRFIKKGISAGLSLAMAVSLFGTVMPAAAELPAAASQKPIMTKAGSVSVSAEAVTYDEPFAPYTAGCQYFRIPAIITLQDGTLLATADARWETTGDGGGIDSIASRSEDGGKTWQYSFPLYFPDSNGYGGNSATTIIDPGVVEGPDGTIYFIADVNPTGSTTMYKTIPTGTGYVTVDNEVDSGRYLALTRDYATSWVTTPPEESNLTAYPYYVSEFDEDGYAEIRMRSDGSPSGWGVDEWYNLYTITNGEYVDDLRQSQVNSSTQIQQNAFYKDSMFHVYSIDYLWVITSKDGGKTWEHPRDLTDQIKRHTGENALLVSPGRGTITSEGDIVIGFYDHGPAGNNQENASLVYSTDNGETWKRTDDVPQYWSSENEVVALEDGTIRMFVRNGRGKICYADMTKNKDGDYVMGTEMVSTGVSCTSTCNVTAISYSKKINGKQAILVGCPTGGTRAYGKIFTFLVEEDNTLTLFDEFSVPGSDLGYVYSCMTEMQDGTVALLWEPNEWTVRDHRSILFDKFSVLEFAPDADAEDISVPVEIKEGETYERTYLAKGELANDGKADSSVAAVTVKTEEGNRVIKIEGIKAGYTETVIDQVTYKIHVVENLVLLSENENTYEISALTAPEEIDDDNITVTSIRDGVNLANHASSTANSLESFSSSVNTEINVSDAEFTFTASGSNWQIHNATKNNYLSNNGAGSYFVDTAQNMKVTKAGDKFRICKADDTRYVFFYYPEMNFNSNSGGYRENYEATGAQELTLLEKQASVSEDDVIPGYKKASNVVSGKNYLICHMVDDNVIILYPENGANNQTKLVKLTYRVTVTLHDICEEIVLIDGVYYKFKIRDEYCEHTDTEIRNVIPKSCLEDGYTGDTYCANPDCAVLIEEGEVVPAEGSHDWDEGMLTKAPTETQDGAIVYTCKNDPKHKMTEVVYASAYALLKAEYEKAATILEEKGGFYTKETITELEKIYEQASAMLEFGANRTNMYQAVAAFGTAVDALEEKSIDKLNEELDKAVLDAENFKNGLNMTEEQISALPQGVWQAFHDAYTADPPQEDASEIYVWTHALEIAKENLAKAVEALSTARTNLQEGIKNAKALYNDGKGAEQYTTETWNPFALAYQNAVNAPANATADDMISLLKLLSAAQGKLAKIEEPPVLITEGYKKTVSQVDYEVTNAAAQTAKAIGTTAASVEILSEITIEGKTYAVTEIDAKAFAGAKKTLKNVTIGDNITAIGDQTFSGCAKLTKVTIGAGVKTIGKKAFFNCKKLKTVTIKGTAVKTIKAQAFKGTHKNIKVKLPKGMKASAKSSLKNKLKKKGKISAKAKIS